MTPADIASDFVVLPEHRELFETLLGSFVPPDSFDAHTHLYELEAVDCKAVPPVLLAGPKIAGWEVYRRSTAAYMGDLAPRDGLFFGYPTRAGDSLACNRFVAEEVARHEGSRGLMLIRPDDDPDEVETQVRLHSWAGFKVYHVYAPGSQTFHEPIGSFLPDWAWEIADRHGLAIMLHMVRSKALADPINSQYIRSHCLKYPSAKLILAHAARGFNASHTVRAIDTLRGLDNVFFDTSAICEPSAFEAILNVFGPRRLFFGTDFPISNFVGKCTSVEDGFYWMYHDNVTWNNWQHCKPTLVGIESLLAIKQAVKTCHLNDSDVELIFGQAARTALNITPAPDGRRTQTLYDTAKNIIPGGTQLLSKRPEMYAPEAWPAYFSEARGVEVFDLDGRRFLDMTTTGIGACLLGYADPDVNQAVARRLMLGSTSSLNSEDEVNLAQGLIGMHPWAHMARFARTGGEAMAVAVRIARTKTRRDVVIFCGYHGWHDWYLAANLTGDEQLNGHLLPGLEPGGVPRGLMGTAIPCAYNQLEELAGIVREQGDRLAAIVMEPTRAVEPLPGYLKAVRDLASRSGAVLVFDEITTGFRLHQGGAHLLYGVSPDIAVFGKALGNGVPISAIIGNAQTMAAAQESFISSTMWTEGLGFAAGHATLSKLKTTDVPKHVHAIGMTLRSSLAETAKAAGLKMKISGHPAITSIAFDHPQSPALMTLFTRLMLKHHILAGSSFYPSMAHEPRHVAQYIAAASSVLKDISRALDRDEVMQRIDHKIKHTGFARLT